MEGEDNKNNRPKNACTVSEMKPQDKALKGLEMLDKVVAITDVAKVKEVFKDVLQSLDQLEIAFNSQNEKVDNPDAHQAEQPEKKDIKKEKSDGDEKLLLGSNQALRVGAPKNDSPNASGSDSESESVYMLEAESFEFLKAWSRPEEEVDIIITPVDSLIGDRTTVDLNDLEEAEVKIFWSEWRAKKPIIGSSSSMDEPPTPGGSASIVSAASSVSVPVQDSQISSQRDEHDVGDFFFVWKEGIGFQMMRYVGSNMVPWVDENDSDGSKVVDLASLADMEISQIQTVYFNNS